ncbi:MAG: chemotaxis protein CheA [Chloroflexi bacterium]|nr:MAG: chemotaxis protein CheA [Chloroflexota bacterium]
MHNYDLTSDEAIVFFEEANELLESLDRDLVALEQSADDALLHRIFRAVHTLKGAAGSIGHEHMAFLAHTAETLLAKVRNHEIGVTTRMANLLFQVVENFKVFLDDVVADRPTQENAEDLIQQINDLQIVVEVTVEAVVTNGMPPLPLIDERRLALLEEEINGGLNLFLIYAEAEPSGVAPLARLLQLYMQMERMAQIVASTPSGEALERGEGTGTLVLVALTDLHSAEIESELSNIFEIALLRVADISNAAHLLGEQQRDPEMSLEAVSTDGEKAVADGEVSLPPAGPTTSDPPIVARRGAAQASRTVRTNVAQLDNLMNLAGELVTDRNRLFQIYEDLSHLLDEDQLTILNDTITHLSTVTDRIHDEVFKARMQPIEYIFNKFPRFVRQLCQELGKEVDLVVLGQETEVDRTVIEQIADPILHLVRNAIYHGIETIEERLAAGKEARGQVELSARSEEGNIIVSITDDGKGVDAEHVKRKAVALGLITEKQSALLSYNEAIELIFAPGLSTAITISELSGRGVGMDVVRNNIQRLSGSVVVYSAPGVGTTFELRLPLTLAIIPTLLVESCEQVFAMPLPNVIEIFKLDPTSVQLVRGRETIYMRGEVLPLVRLSQLFERRIMRAHNGAENDAQMKVTGGERAAGPGYVVSISHRDVHLGVIVSNLLGKQDVVIKALGYPINNVRGLTGVTLLGDGRIGLIIDMAALVSMAVEPKAALEEIMQSA